MTKAKSHLTPRRVLGNRLTSERLSIDETSAALVAMLAGAQAIPPRRELRNIASSIRQRLERAGVSRKLQIAALTNELDAAITVWVDLPLQSARTRKASAHVSALQARLASLQTMEMANV
jgi:hypothetical protein